MRLTLIQLKKKKRKEVLVFRSSLVLGTDSFGFLRFPPSEPPPSASCTEFGFTQVNQEWPLSIRFHAKKPQVLTSVRPPSSK
ncbi:hypothetical protein M5K25_002162 [Dendrobium thyrsiflorum]|uniref:Uncharacterized protein n=1 Tax=Dendrobium thyrsiflorum TaxID=117978 RepID=A0ABD0W4L2_DENTH